MASIRVTPSAVAKAADAIDEFINTAEQELTTATQEVGDLAGGWQGMDYDLFLANWASGLGTGSATLSYLGALQNNSNYLRAAALLYSKAANAARSEASCIGGSGFSGASTTAQDALSGVLSALGVNK